MPDAGTRDLLDKTLTPASIEMLHLNMLRAATRAAFWRRRRSRRRKQTAWWQEAACLHPVARTGRSQLGFAHILWMPTRVRPCQFDAWVPRSTGASVEASASSGALTLPRGRAQWLRLRVKTTRTTKDLLALPCSLYEAEASRPAFASKAAGSAAEITKSVEADATVRRKLLSPEQMQPELPVQALPHLLGCHEAKHKRKCPHGVQPRAEQLDVQIAL